MKTVFPTNAECIHAFAQRNQSNGRSSGGNVFFEDDKLFSYGRHYVLAEFMESGRYVVINNEGYSVSTSKHIGMTIGALRHRRTFYTMDINLSNVYNTVKANERKLLKARKPELYISEISYAWNKLNEFLDYANPKYIKTDKRYREIKRLVKAIESDPKGIKDRLADFERKRAEQKRKDDAKAVKDALSKFRSYETSYFRYGNEDFIRISKDGQSVETSQGVKVSRESAKALYAMIRRGIDIKGRQIEQYTVTSINGTLRIGCHNINMQSVHEIGTQL